MAKQSTRDNYDKSNIDALLEALFSVSDSLFAVSDSALIDASLDALVESRSTDSDENDDFIQRALHVGSLILEAGKSSARKRSSVHNASVWPLTPDLTIKVFSMLDTPSVWSAAATCSFFQECARYPLCYTNIDLATLVPKIKPKIIVPKINDSVSTTIERAGNALQSIKIGARMGCCSYDEEEARLRKMLPFLTGSCLSSLSANGGAAGSRLRRLHLYNIEMMDETANWEERSEALSEALSTSLSVCPSLFELKIVNMDVNIGRTLESVSRYCRLLKCFIYEYNGTRDDPVEASVCKEFLLNCPNITTLALQACKVYDSQAFELVKGFNELKYVDFTRCRTLTGTFLEDLATKGGGNNLKVMILRGCYNLDKVEVTKFMKALLAGKLRHLRHLDISESCGVSSIIPLKKLLQQRPNFCLVNKTY